jgi:hypothetical protein
LKIPDFFIDTYFKNAGKNRLLKILTHLPENKISEMVVHLGKGEISKKKDLPNGFKKKNFKPKIKELNVLKKELSAQVLTDHQVEIKSFSDL